MNRIFRTLVVGLIFGINLCSAQERIHFEELKWTWSMRKLQGTALVLDRNAMHVPEAAGDPYRVRADRVVEGAVRWVTGLIPVIGSNNTAFLMHEVDVLRAELGSQRKTEQVLAASIFVCPPPSLDHTVFNKLLTSIEDEGNLLSLKGPSISLKSLLQSPGQVVERYSVGRPEDIQPTSTTRRLLLEAAAQAYHVPSIHERIITTLGLTPEIIAANPELKNLIDACKAAVQQAGD